MSYKDWLPQIVDVGSTEYYTGCVYTDINKPYLIKT